MRTHPFDRRRSKVVTATAAVALLTACGTDLQAPSPAVQTGAVARLTWPVGLRLLDGVYVMNYVDQGRGGQPQDHGCGRVTFAGHKGTDIALPSFRDMDRGVPVFAAASGRVLVIRDGFPDRIGQPPFPGELNDVNQIQIGHADGTSAWYAHLRTHSIAVSVGDEVQAGEFLGYVGSSGWSNGPHLHFEMWDGTQFGSRVIDPFGGPCNGGPDRWQEPLGYVGDDGINLLDADVTLDLSLVGAFGNVSGILALKERLDTPAVVDRGEPALGAWVLYQAYGPTTYRLRVQNAAGATVVDEVRPTRGGLPFTWEVIRWDLAASPRLDEGRWTLTVESQGRTIRRAFEVGDETAFGPRFQVAGRSLRYEGGRVTEVLTFRGERPAELRLEDAPTGVSLVDDQLILDGVRVSTRNTLFRVVAVDRAGRTDVKRYHLVDPTRPVDPAFRG